MTISDNFKKKLWLKSIIIGAVYSIILSIGFYFTNKFIPGYAVINPIYVLIAGLIISICFPVFLDKFYKKGSILPKEYRHIEELFEKNGNDIIIKYLGEKTLLSLYNEDLNQIDINGISICSDLLKNKELNSELNFYILTKLAIYQAKDGQKSKAIDNFKKALSIKPDDLIANIKLSEIYERTGNAHESILFLNKGIQIIKKDKNKANLIAFLENQIERIKRQGPRKDPPMTGFKHMSH